MKKVLLLLAVLLVGCNFDTVPIEKYGGSRYVIAHKSATDWGRLYDVQLKNKDTIFWINVLKFDAENINVGDTIR